MSEGNPSKIPGSKMPRTIPDDVIVLSVSALNPWLSLETQIEELYDVSPARIPNAPLPKYVKPEPGEYVVYSCAGTPGALVHTDDKLVAVYVRYTGFLSCPPSLK